MEILFLLVVVLSLAVGGVFLVCIGDDERNPFLAIIGAISTMFGVIGLIFCMFVSWDFFASGYKAELLNKEYGTNYTRMDVLFAEDIIDTVRELKRQRIEINGNLLREGE